MRSVSARAAGALAVTAIAVLALSIGAPARSQDQPAGDAANGRRLYIAVGWLRVPWPRRPGRRLHWSRPGACQNRDAG